MSKERSYSIRKGVGKTETYGNVWLYHVLIDGHTVRSFLHAKEAEAYIRKIAGNVPLVRRDY